MEDSCILGKCREADNPTGIKGSTYTESSGWEQDSCKCKDRRYITTDSVAVGRSGGCRDHCGRMETEKEEIIRAGTKWEAGLHQRSGQHASFVRAGM